MRLMILMIERPCVWGGRGGGVSVSVTEPRASLEKLRKQAQIKPRSSLSPLGSVWRDGTRQATSS